MHASAFILFALTSLVFIFTPGPDILYVITRSLTQGRRAGLAAALGFASGLPVHSAAAAFGLALLLRSSPVAIRTLAMAGAAYLLYLAIRTLRSPDAFLPAVSSDSRSIWSIYLQSLTMNLLNPKVALFFLTFLPGFLPTQAAHPTILTLFLGLTFTVLTIAGFSSAALLAGSLGNVLRTRPAVGSTLRYVTALLFLALAVNLALYRP